MKKKSAGENNAMGIVSDSEVWYFGTSNGDLGEVDMEGCGCLR